MSEATSCKLVCVITKGYVAVQNRCQASSHDWIWWHQYYFLSAVGHAILKWLTKDIQIRREADQDAPQSYSKIHFLSWVATSHLRMPKTHAFWWPQINMRSVQTNPRFFSSNQGKSAMLYVLRFDLEFSYLKLKMHASKMSQQAVTIAVLGVLGNLLPQKSSRCSRITVFAQIFTIFAMFAFAHFLWARRFSVAGLFQRLFFRKSKWHFN